MQEKGLHIQIYSIPFHSFEKKRQHNNHHIYKTCIRRTGMMIVLSLFSILFLFFPQKKDLNIRSFFVVSSVGVFYQLASFDTILLPSPCLLAS